MKEMPNKSICIIVMKGEEIVEAERARLSIGTRSK
jgi:hypothetical protein